MNISFNPNLRSRTGNVNEMLNGVKYKLDFYQREYVWSKENVLQLLEDLTSCFLNDYRPDHSQSMVAKYSRYFLGEIVTCKQGPYLYIIDGQQRLTTLTLLLVLIRNLQNDSKIEHSITLDRLIFSKTYGKESFNLNIEERIPCMEALYHNVPFEIEQQSSSVKNMYQRYMDLQENWPDELTSDALPNFANWLIHRVYLVEVSIKPIETTLSIFANLNDHGLPLSPVDLLKGYLLSNIDSKRRTDAATTWRNLTTEINGMGKGNETNFITDWFRSKYAQNISSCSEDVNPQDFERIGTDFHRWLRENKEEIGLRSSNDYFQFIDGEFRFFSQQYVKLIEASRSKKFGLDSVRHVTQLGAEFQFMVLLSPLRENDNEETINKKIHLTSYFIEILLVRLLWNNSSIEYSDLVHPIFTITKCIRNLDLHGLERFFTDYLNEEVSQFKSPSMFRLNSRNKKYVHWILARITDYVEVESGFESHFDRYLNQDSNGFEVEHILPSVLETSDEADSTEFLEHEMNEIVRNKLGGLILLPKQVSQKINSQTFNGKLSHYRSENLLARSWHPDSYRKDSKFAKFLKRSKLSFKPISVDFSKNDVLERCQLYSEIAELIWSPVNFSKFV